MNELQKVRESPGDFLLCMVLIMLPISITATNVFAVLLVLWWLIKVRGNKFKAAFAARRNAIAITVAPILFLLFTLSYTSDPKAGFHSIEKYLLLLIFPVLVGTFQFKRSVDFFMTVFAAVISGMCLICLVAGIYRFLFKDAAGLPLVGDLFTGIPTPWNTLTNSNLSTPFSINPIYFSLYVSFSLMIIMFVKGIRLRYRVVLFSILLVVQILLASRIGLAAMFVAGAAGIYFIPKGSRRYFGWSAVACVSVLVISVVINPVLRKRYSTEIMAWETPADVAGWNAVNLRNAIWSCSAKVISESPVWGKGAGGAAAPRENCYRQHSFYGHFGTDFNSHNQYIEYTLTGGIILLALFLLQLGYSFRIAVVDRQALHYLFLIIFAVVAFGESLLESHKGIVFFSCFNSLFIFKPSSPVNV